LKKINRAKYKDHHFIDALFYDSGKFKLVFILTFEDLIIVDAKTKDVTKEIMSRKLFKVIAEEEVLIVLLQDKSEGFRIPIKNSLVFDRFYTKLSNYIFHIHTEY